MKWRYRLKLYPIYQNLKATHEKKKEKKKSRNDNTIYLDNNSIMLHKKGNGWSIEIKRTYYPFNSTNDIITKIRAFMT